MYNTPNTFGIYLMGLVLKWALAQGGLTEIARRNERKAAKLYAEIDRTGFYRGTAEKSSRSLMPTSRFISSRNSTSRGPLATWETS